MERDPRLQALTLADVLREHRRSWPTQVAAVDGDVRLTYRDLDERVNRVAHGLAALGVAPGDRVLWLAQNSFRVLELLLAAAKLGAMFCPANWRMSADEVAFVLDDLTPTVVVWQDEEIGETITQARARAAHQGATWLRHDHPDPADRSSYEATLAKGSPEDDFGDTDPYGTVLLIYTAAWEGRPNAAMLSSTNIVAQSLVMAAAADIDADYRYLNSGPLFHLGTLMQTFATFLSAGTNVFTRRVDAEELCRLVDRERCTGAFIVGPTFREIIEVNREGRYDLTSLRASAGRPEWTRMITVDTSPWARNPGGYGQTEVMGMLTFNTLATAALGSHGRASPVVQVRIVDPGDREVPEGETGEIVARGLTVMNGYWNRAEVNAARLRGGWHHTNDLGRREADGTITFIGPKTRMIKSAAENIYPAEVEGAIRRHPAVADVAVIGVPDKKWTQSVKAIVVVKDGETLSSDEVIEHCRTLIASYKKPRVVEFVDALPRRGFAVDYDALDAAHGGGGYPGGTNRSA